MAKTTTLAASAAATGAVRALRDHACMAQSQHEQRQESPFGPSRAKMSRTLAWPSLVRPAQALLYLDLNHYIGLAKVRAGVKRVPEDYSELSESLLEAVRSNRLVVPLSGDHLFELSTISDPRQRRDIAAVMEDVSLFQYLLGRTQIAEQEIEAGIRSILGEQPPIIPLPLVRGTAGHAFGMKGGVRIVDTHGRDVADEARERMGESAHSELLRAAFLACERALLEGPSDAEAVRLRSEYGYAPEIAHKSRESRLEFELSLSEMLSADERWRRGRLRDVVAAREFTHEWLDVLNRVNRERTRAGLVSFDARDADFLRLENSMPHSQVAISVKTRYHRNPRHPWTVNDIADIDAVSVAYAYCDAVFTDKAVRHAIVDSRELRAIPTYMPKRPAELIDWIRGLPAPAIGADFQLSVARS